MVDKMARQVGKTGLHGAFERMRAELRVVACNRAGKEQLELGGG
jgi:hypothetical protein